MMDLNPVNVVVLGATLLSAVASIVGFFWWREKVDAAWAEVAAKLKLEAKKSSWGHRCIAGKVGRYQVTIETVTKGSGKNSQTYTRYTVDGRGTFDPEMELKAESAWEGFKKVFAGEDVHLEDADFDEAVNVKGPEDSLLAALGAQTRRVVLRLVERRCQVKGGKITTEVAGVSRDVGFMVGLAQAMLAGADALRVQDIAAALRTHAREDPSPGVRRRNLEALVRRDRDRPETRRAIEDALADRDPGLRLYAAGVLRTGPGVREVLEALFDDPRGLTEAQRGQALELLVECFPYEAVAPRVARALDLPSEALRVAAVRAAGEAGDGSPLLARPDLARTTEAGLGVALAEALGKASGAAGESMLLDLLKADAVAVKVAAAKALGAVGTVRAVEPLLPFTQGLFADGELKDAARDAVRGIQARLGEVEAGGLSVVDERVGEGGLSLHDGKSRERGGSGG